MDVTAYRRSLRAVAFTAVASVLAGPAVSATAFRPTTLEDVAVARNHLSRAADRLSQHLDRSGNRGEAWRQYLKLSDLQVQLKNDAPDESILEDVLHRFTADHSGLELPHCCAVRKSLRIYLRTLHDMRDGGLAGQYADRLAILESCLKDEQLGDAARREALSNELAWFLAHNQAVSLTREVRRRYRVPNLFVGISEAFINQALAQQIEETTPIRQMQGNTAIRGSASVRGDVRAVLVDNDEQAEFDLIFDGAMSANMIGSRGPVSVGVRSDAGIAASKRLWLTETGFSAMPSQSNMALKTRLTGASTRFCCRLLDRSVSRIALRVAEREKGTADTQAARDAQRLINDRFDEEVYRLAAELQQQYLDRYRNPLLRRDAFPEHFSATTAHGRLRLNILQAAADQLGAEGEPPHIADEADVALRLHESFVDNFAETMFGGRTLSESELRAELQGLTGGVFGTDDPLSHDDNEVAITFPERRPLTLLVGEGTVAITLRGARYISGSRAYPPMNVTVRFRLERLRDGYLAELIGEPEIVPPRFADQDSPRRYSGREAALRRLLANRLERHVEKRIEADHLTLPQPIGDITALSVRQLCARNGWLTASLALDGRPETDAKTPITPAMLRQSIISE